MDFRSLARKELQALCKRNKIPANITNVAMADALEALQHVEGLEEILNPSDSNLSKSPEKTVIGLPDIPRTACRTSTRRKPIKVESESTQPLTRSRRGTRGKITKDIDQENNDVNVPITPAGPSSRRRAPAASACRNIETQLREDEEDEKYEAQGKSDVPKTPAVTSSRRRAPTASARTKWETQNGVYSTRRSVRLLEQNIAKLSIMENGEAEPAKIDDLFEEPANCSERSEVSVEVEKNISGANTQTMSEVGSAKTNNSEVLSDPKSIGSLDERGSEIDVEYEDKSDDDDEYEVQELGTGISDNLGVLKVSDAIAEALDEGSDESDVILSEKLEEAIDVNFETVDEKRPANVPVTEQDTGAVDSLAIENHVIASKSLRPEHSIDWESVEESLQPNLLSQSSSDVQDECQNLASKDSDMNVAEIDDIGSIDWESVEESLQPNLLSQSSSDVQDECQNLASKDSDMNVAEIDDIGSHDSESECTTDGDFDGDNASDENSSKCQENISDDDAETEEKDPEAPVLPEDQIVGFGKLESTTESMKNMSPGLLVSDSEVTLSTAATNSLSEDKTPCHADDPMAKVQESIQSENLVDVMPAHELTYKCPPSLDKTPTSVKKMSPDLVSDRKITCKSPFAADQLSGQFPRPTQLTPRKSPAIKQIRKITNVSDDDEEGGIDNDDWKMELKKDMARQDENPVYEDNMLETYKGMSLRQLEKKLKQMLITQNKDNDKGKSATKEQLGKKRIALQTLPENRMAVDESDKGE